MEDENVRSRGTVVRFDDQKGYGFIKPDDGGEDLFVHHSSIKSDGFRSLQQGQSVEFSVALEGDHTKAVDVTSLGGNSFPPPPRRNFRSTAARGCYSCGRDGHISRDCPSGGGGGGGCFSCGQEGHIARDCPDSRGGGGGGGCYNCGMTGHIARECRQGGGGGGEGCYNCGGFGHIARECPSGRVNGGGGGRGGNCFSCGEAGHFERECTNKA